MNIDNEIKLDFCDVLIRPKRSKATSREKVDLNRDYKFLNANRSVTSVPIIASNMDTTGTIAMTHVMSQFGMWGCLHKHYDWKEITDLLRVNPQAFFSTGITTEDFDKLKIIKQVTTEGCYPAQFICIDVANGYTEFFQDQSKRIRDMFPEAVIMAGNVATPEIVEGLLLSGAADIVKIGIGPGSVCTTRIVAGVGYPQLSAIMECADAAHGLGGHICADGGCLTPGDVAKAFGGGADFVMIGGMLAGTDECDGEWELENGFRKAMKFYGMSSREAMQKHHGGIAGYKAAEGRCTSIPYKGPAGGVIRQILGGLRSACTYAGAMKLKDLSKCCTFVRVNRIYNNVL